jgi:uracil-DNA glycosylase
VTGVLLLNACLTVRSGQANSHAGKGWEKLTDATISWLNKNLSGVVFMLWGAYAQKKGACINSVSISALPAFRIDIVELEKQKPSPVLI